MCNVSPLSEQLIFVIRQAENDRKLDPENRIRVKN